MSGSSRKSKVSKRVIVKTVPFEPDNSVGPSRRKNDGGEANNLLYLRNTFLAVRNDEDGFYICRALQHIYEKTRHFSVLWLEEEQSQNAYELGHKDQLDVHCILTAVRLMRLKQIGKIRYLLTKNQKQKVEKALLESLHGELTSEDDEETSDEEPPKKRQKIDTSPKKGSLKKQKSIDNSSKGKLRKTSSALEAAKVIKKRALDNAVAKGKKKGEKNKSEKAKTTRASAKKVVLVPRGSIKVLEKDPFLHSKEKVPFVSSLAHSKIVFRAAVQNDIELLKELIEDRGHVAETIAVDCLGFDYGALLDEATGNTPLPLCILLSLELCGIHSMTRTETAVHIALENENLDFLEIICEEIYGNYDPNKPKRVAQTTSLLKPESTGRYNSISIPGVRYVRKLNMSRGSREGNNAFIKDLESFTEFEHWPAMLKHAIQSGVSKETLDKFCAMTRELSDTKEECYGLISLAVQWGHRKLAAALMDDVTKSGVNSFNFLHCEVLAFDNEELRSNIREISIRKKCFGNDKMTPLHCAAINPNQKYLAQLLSLLPDFNIVDSARRCLIHYAVACEGTGPLELLLQNDVNLTAVDGNGLSPLITACLVGRLHNVQLLLSHAKNEESKKLAAEDGKNPEEDVCGEGDAKQKRKTKRKTYGLCGVNMPASKPTNEWFSYTPLHISAHLGRNEIIKTLIAYGADVNKELSASKNKLTPLMVAASRGHLETVRLLVKLGAKVTQRDKIMRTPMMLASMNGHAHVVSLLLSLGCSPDDSDSSGNTALHYAAGYGWYFCAKVLLDAKADCSVPNSWKTTPLGIAFLKGHIGLADVILEQPSVDINFRLDGGLTLVHTACSSALIEGIVEQLEYLVVKKNADCTLLDDGGSNALHHLAKNNIKLQSVGYRNYKACESAMARSVMMAQMLIQHGCNVLEVDASDRTSLMFAVEQGNLRLAESLVKNGAGVSTGVDNSDRNIMHFISEQCMTQPMAEVLSMLLETTTDKKIFVEMAQQCDAQGMTPLIRACYQYKDAAPAAADQWEDGRIYIHKLMEICGSAADIPLQVRPFSKSDVIPEKEEDRYFNKSFAGFNVVHFLVDVRQEQAKVITENNRVFKKSCPGLTTLLKLLPNKSPADKYNHFGRTPLLEALARNRSSEASELIDFGVDVNAKSKDKETDGLASPLVLAAKNGVTGLIGKLLKHGARPNDYDANTLCTALLYTIKNPVMSALQGTVETLLAHKASTTAVDKQQKTALHLLMELPGDRRVAIVIAGLLLKAGAVINACDHKGRTPLHLAVNLNPGDANCSVQLEQFLLERGADPLARDWLQRLPLHYVFVKIGNHTDISTLDPTELYSAMTNTKKLSQMVNHGDQFCLTPLHVAARRGAAVCCLDLIKSGSDVNSKDVDGNTALSLAVWHKHESCTILLLQNDGDIGGDIVIVPPPRKEETADTKKENKEKPQWNWTHTKTVEKTPKTKKFSIFQGAIANEWQGVIFLMLRLLDKFSLSLPNMVHAAFVIQKYYLSQSLIRKARNKKELLGKLENDQNLAHILAKTSMAENENLLIGDVAQLLFERGVPFDAEDEYGCTPLHYACLQGCKPLVQFILGHCKNINLEKKDRFGRTAMTATFWKYSKNRSVNWLIARLLHSHGASLDLCCSYPIQQVYMFGKARSTHDLDDDFHSPAKNPRISPLILSILYHDRTMVAELIKMGAGVNFPDMDRRRPLMVAVAENDIHIVRLLLDHDYQEPTNLEVQQELEEEEQALMEAVNQPEQQLSGNVFTLGRRLQKLPSLNKILNANQTTSETASKLIIVNGLNMSAKCYPKTSAVDMNAMDCHSRSLLHYLIQQPPNGSHENYRMLLQLVSAGAPLWQRDNSGKTVLDHALGNGLSKLAMTIQYLGDPKRKTFTTPHYECSLVSDGITWNSAATPDFRNDSAKFIEKFEKDLASKEDESDVFKAVPDSYISESNTGHVLTDSDLDLPYDILMTKIDVAAGKWGLYNFYKMQIVHQKGKDLYILFTRWGRIGDHGQFQTTPFPCKDEAVKEFCKIFLSKSGNKWQGVKSFETLPGKYRLVPWEKRIYGRKATDIKIDLTSKLPSKLHPYVKDMISEIADVTTLTSSMDRMEIDRSLIPFGRIEKETLAKAAAILLELKPMVNLLSEMRSKAATTDMNKYAEELEKVMKLSNEYYHLIPKKDFEYERIPIIDKMDRLEKEWNNIESLMELELAAKIIIGAQYSIKTMNPMDYVYRCLDCQIQLMDENEIESQYLLRYTSATWNGKVEAIYRIARKGEEQRLIACGIENRRLLFHGSDSCNLISILSKGLLIAPPEASITGSALGKGIYTSDEFEKSRGYCRNYKSGSRVKYMLVCEVALGKIKGRYNYHVQEAEVVGYQSVQGLGQQHPDALHDLTLPTGAVIPLGDNKHRNTVAKQGLSLRHNEYVVYNESQICLRYIIQFLS